MQTLQYLKYQNVCHDTSIMSQLLEASWFQTITNFTLSHTLAIMSTQRWLEKLRKLYDPQEDEQASRQREYVSRLMMYLPRILEKLNLDWEDVLSCIVDTVCIFRASFWDRNASVYYQWVTSL
jgi:hypothetical protein